MWSFWNILVRPLIEMFQNLTSRVPQGSILCPILYIIWLHIMAIYYIFGYIMYNHQYSWKYLGTLEPKWNCCFHQLRAFKNKLILICFRHEKFTTLFYLQFRGCCRLMQNAIAALLTRAKKTHHITSILVPLLWLLVGFGIGFKILLITFKWTGPRPVYPSELLYPCSAKHC